MLYKYVLKLKLRQTHELVSACQIYSSLAESEIAQYADSGLFIRVGESQGGGDGAASLSLVVAFAVVCTIVVLVITGSSYCHWSKMYPRGERDGNQDCEEQEAEMPRLHALGAQDEKAQRLDLSHPALRFSLNDRA